MVRFVALTRSLPFGLAASLVLLCLAFTVAEAKDKGSSKPKKDALAKVEGVITNVDMEKGAVTIRKRRGALVTVTVSATTKIEVDDAHAALSDLKVDMFGEAKYDPATFVAKKIEGETSASP